MDPNPLFRISFDHLPPKVRSVVGNPVVANLLGQLRPTVSYNGRTGVRVMATVGPDGVEFRVDQSEESE